MKRPTIPTLIEQADAAGVALFATAVPLPDDGSAPEWVTVFPRVGRVETRDGRAFQVSAETLMAAFAEDGVAIPVDVNHATDAAGLFGGPAPAVGWGVQLRAEGGGLQLKVDWLAEGRALLAARQYLYTSPSFYQDKNRATRLKALALVTSPALARQPALARAARLASSSASQEQPPMNAIAQALGLAEGADEAALLGAIGARTEIRPLAAALGLAETASAAECLAAIGTLKAGGGEQVALLRSQLETASARLAAVEKAARDKAVADLLDGALRVRKIVPAQRAHLEALCAGEAGLAGVTAMLAATMPGLQPSGLDERQPGPGAAQDPVQLAAAATKLQAERAAAGQLIGYAEAVAEIAAKA